MQWTALFGARALLDLNIAFFLPSLPVLASQLLLGGRLDSKYGLVLTNTIRACGGGCSAAPWKCCACVSQVLCQRLMPWRPR